MLNSQLIVTLLCHFLTFIDLHMLRGVCKYMSEKYDYSCLRTPFALYHQNYTRYGRLKYGDEYDSSLYHLLIQQLKQCQVLICNTVKTFVMKRVEFCSCYTSGVSYTPNCDTKHTELDTPPNGSKLLYCYPLNGCDTYNVPVMTHIYYVVIPISWLTPDERKTYRDWLELESIVIAEQNAGRDVDQKTTRKLNKLIKKKKKIAGNFMKEIRTLTYDDTCPLLCIAV
jgi:hypothetical protein